MLQRRTLTALALSLVAASLLSVPAARAAEFPTRPITLVVPFAPGGPTDTVGRLIAERMSSDLGQQVIVENVAGAGGTVGTARVAAAAPDGHTVLLYNISMASTAVLYRKLPYDTATAFDYVGLVTDVPMTLVARKDLGITDLAGLAAHVRANPGTVTMGNAGIGGASHLCGMLLQEAVSAPVVNVPYKGTGPAMTDLLAGQIDLMCDQTTNTAGHIRSGGIVPIAVTTPARIGILPDLPTTAEGGLPSVSIVVWHGVYTPKGTPAAVNARLSRALRAALADPGLVEKLAGLGSTPVAAAEATPEALAARHAAELARWKPVIEKVGVYAD